MLRKRVRLLVGKVLMGAGVLLVAAGFRTTVPSLLLVVGIVMAVEGSAPLTESL